MASLAVVRAMAVSLGTTSCSSPRPPNNTTSAATTPTATIQMGFSHTMGTPNKRGKLVILASPQESRFTESAAAMAFGRYTLYPYAPSDGWVRRSEPDLEPRKLAGRRRGSLVSGTDVASHLRIDGRQ